MEINVFLGLDKSTPGAPKVLVQPDPTASHSGGDVIWRFQSLDDDVDSVRVEFADQKDTYFTCRDTPTARSNKCHTNLTGKGAYGGRQGRVLGTTPTLGSPGAKASKYSIIAFRGDPDRGGAPIPGYELDPTIVTVDP